MEVREIEDVVLLEETGTNQGVLSRLVNYEPQSHISPKLKSYPINELPDIATQEALVVYDLLSVLQGIGGIYIRFNKEYDPHVISSVPQFRLVKKMDPSLKSFCSKIVNLGKYYIMLKQASEMWSGDKYGIVLQRLGFEIRTYLNDVYLKFVIDELKSRFNEKMRFSLREFKQVVNNSQIFQEMQILNHIRGKIMEEMDMRSKIDPDQVKFSNLLAELKGIDNSDNVQDSRNGNNENLDDKYSVFIDNDYFPVAKGGVILNVISNAINDCLGDLHAVEFMKQLLDAISEPYCDTMHQWITQGKLNDIHDEFMINDTMKHFKGNINNPIEYERIWLTQYCVRKDGLISKFQNGQNKELLFKIVMTGKLLNLIRISLQLSQLPMNDIDDSMMRPISVLDMFEGTKFELYINYWYHRANDLTTRLFYDNYKLKEIIISLQRHFFGYCNGQIFEKLLTKNFNELTRKKNNSWTNNKLIQFLNNERDNERSKDIILSLLTINYDKFSFKENILQENERYNNFENNFNELIGQNNNNNTNINNFTNALLQDIDVNENIINDSVTDFKSNIHYLTFDISIPYPINVIVNRVNITQYQTISRYLHLIEYHSKLLDEIWLEINKNKIWRYTNYSSDIYYKIIKRSRLIHTRMNHYIKTLNEIIIMESIDKEMSELIHNKYDNIIDLQNDLEIKLSNIMGNNNLMDLMDIQLQMFDIIEIFIKFILGLRYKLCQLDYNLYDRYITKRGKHMDIPLYDEDESLLKFNEINQFLTTVQIRFNQHFQVFCEGLDVNNNGNEQEQQHSGKIITDDNGNNWPLNEKLLNALLGQRI
ncbi:hypothetical protein C6P45_004100 [Maudiozyma exigua]|uniref:Spindle pole body component n=1 Tax=Maudiozyma exigua TaxID=34358 RepID=A0A9P6WEG1_MAUEX|nr:hypothetical protein C6P45_004100 [Kazachstania exigua]